MLAEESSRHQAELELRSGGESGHGLKKWQACCECGGGECGG